MRGEWWVIINGTKIATKITIQNRHEIFYTNFMHQNINMYLIAHFEHILLQLLQIFSVLYVLELLSELVYISSYVFVYFCKNTNIYWNVFYRSMTWTTRITFKCFFQFLIEVYVYMWNMSITLHFEFWLCLLQCERKEYDCQNIW